MKFSEEKNQIMKQTFSLKKRLWIESFSTCQIFNWEFIVPEGIENKTFWIIIFWRKFIFQKLRFLSSSFIRKSDFEQKLTSEKKRSDSICSGKNNKFFTFRAYFKRHDFEASFFLKIRVWNGIFWKKNRILEWNFFLQIDQFLNREFFVVADFENFFPIIVLWRENFFLKFIFWIHFSLRNQTLIKRSHLRNNVLTWFPPRKTTRFSLFVLILKGMILK